MSLERLKQAVADSNITQVARKINVSRTTLSLVINDKYPASPQKILEQFERAYSDVNCPYSGKTLTRDECNGRSTAPRPSGGTTKTAWWDACQNCPHKGG
jgi:hypothetical protein